MLLLDRLYWTAYAAWHLRAQGSYPYRSLAAIKRDQSRRVRSIVAYAYRSVPYYRETMDRLGLAPTDFSHAQDLAKLPLLERWQIQRDPLYYVSTAQPLERCLVVRNSGSTARPCLFYFDPATACMYAATNGRGRSVWAPLLDRGVGYRQTHIGSPRGSSGGFQSFYGQYIIAPPGVAVHRQRLSLLDPPEKNVPLINEFQPDVIVAFGSYLAMLFHYLKQSGRAMHRPKVLLYSGDGLPDSARRLIEDHFGLPIFGSYEATESYNIGFECEAHKGLHLNIDLCHTRVVDAEGHTLPDGESGHVVVSNLLNRATVLLNHRLGDVAATLSEPCLCGRSLPLLSQLHGRSDDYVRLPSGRWVHPQVMPIMIRHCTEPWEHQVVQETESRFVVSVVPREDCDQMQTRRCIQERFAEELGGDIVVEVRFVDTIDRTAAGKVRNVISMASKAWLEEATREEGP